MPVMTRESLILWIVNSSTVAEQRQVNVNIQYEQLLNKQTETSILKRKVVFLQSWE